MEMPPEGPETLDMDSMGSDLMPPQMAASMPPPAMAPSAPPAGASPVSSLEVSEDGVELKVGDVEIEIHRTEADDELDEAVARRLGNAASRKFKQEVAALSKRHGVLKAAIAEARSTGTEDQKLRIAKIFESLARDAVKLQRQVILNERTAGGVPLETKLLSSIIKEMKDMSRRNNKNVFDFLFEAEEADDMMAPADAAPADEPADADAPPDADEPVEASPEVEAALKDLADALGMEVVPKGTAEPEGEGTEGEGTEDEGAVVEMDDGQTYEIAESDLRRELKRLRSLHEADAVAGSGASSFGGGKAGDDMFVDVDEETLLNALADELGSVKKIKSTAKMAEARVAKPAVNEAAVLRRQVQDYRNVADQLKKQIVEMNLFNAKLLYANKLMQNRDLSAKQQRAIVEAIDNAKTLREAKLLYKSLTDSLNKPTNRGGLTEGRDLRVLGSSSKSARSGQPVAEGAAGADRWALLAGIKKD